MRLRQLAIPGILLGIFISVLQAQAPQPNAGNSEALFPRRTRGWFSADGRPSVRTGVITNSPVADATPAATYAHANDRATFGQIFRYVVEPCYGDGVDVAIGPGVERIVTETQALGIDLPSARVWLAEEPTQVRLEQSDGDTA